MEAEDGIVSEEIHFYRATGEHGYLSNLFYSPFVFEDMHFNCAETAYQYGKPREKYVADWLVAAPKPHLCAAAAHSLFVFDVRSDWNEIKVDRMRAILRVKFAAHSALRNQLLS